VITQNHWRRWHHCHSLCECVCVTLWVHLQNQHKFLLYFRVYYICRVGQNHIYIYMYGYIYTVYNRCFLAWKSSNVREYAVNIKSYGHPMLMHLYRFCCSPLLLVSDAYMPLLPALTHTHTHTRTHSYHSQGRL